MSQEVQQTLAEIRKLNLKFDELSLQIQVDTPWRRIKDHFTYALHLVQEIPIISRWCVLAAVIGWTIAIAFKVSGDIKKKLLMMGFDLIAFAFLTIGQP